MSGANVGECALSVESPCEFQSAERSAAVDV